MRWYLVTMLAIAFLVGILFRATEVTGMRIWNMFGTMGIFFFGLVGSLALSRLQQRSGNKQVEAALKALEPDWVITDWQGKSGGMPDYLLVGPTGILSICVDQTPQSSFGWLARPAIQRGRRRAEAAASWVRTRLGDQSDTPVLPLLLLARRKAVEEYTADGVVALNPDQLATYLRSSGQPVLLESPARIRLTRLLREHSQGNG